MCLPITLHTILEVHGLITQENALESVVNDPQRRPECWAKLWTRSGYSEVRMSLSVKKRKCKPLTGVGFPHNWNNTGFIGLSDVGLKLCEIRNRVWMIH